MAFEEMIKKALDESRNNCRLGDTLEEVQEIQNYIKNAEKIYIPNKNGIKVNVLNKVLREYNLPSAKILQIKTMKQTVIAVLLLQRQLWHWTYVMLI